MPVLGLPDTLESLLATLQDKTGLLSWKICSQDPNTTTVVLRFTGQPLEEKASAPRHYRTKCPSQRRRDQARQQAYVTQLSAKQVSDCDIVHSVTEDVATDQVCHSRTSEHRDNIQASDVKTPTCVPTVSPLFLPVVSLIPPLVSTHRMNVTPTKV